MTKNMLAAGPALIWVILLLKGDMVEAGAGASAISAFMAFAAMCAVIEEGEMKWFAPLVMLELGIPLLAISIW